MHWRLFILSIQFLICIDIHASINEEKFINKIEIILTESKINKGDFSLSLQKLIVIILSYQLIVRNNVILHH